MKKKKKKNGSITDCTVWYSNQRYQPIQCFINIICQHYLFNNWLIFSSSSSNFVSLAWLASCKEEI